MPILVEADTTTAGVLAAALPQGSRVVAREDEAHHWLANRSDYALVLGPTLPLPDATSLAERVRMAHPSTAVILLRHDLAPEVYAYAMQSGIGAVVAADDQVALGAALNRARQTWETIHGAGRSDEREGRVFTVFSPKGGVGKTTMSVNLGLALSQTGASVCVVDLDLAFGDVAITLQLIPSHTISDAAGSEEDLDDSLLQSLLTRHDSGLTILAAPTHPEGRDRIPAVARAAGGADAAQALRLRRHRHPAGLRRPGPGCLRRDRRVRRRRHPRRARPSRTRRSPWRPSTCCTWSRATGTWC